MARQSWPSRHSYAYSRRENADQRTDGDGPLLSRVHPHRGWGAARGAAVQSQWKSARGQRSSAFTARLYQVSCLLLCILANAAEKAAQRSGTPGACAFALRISPESVPRPPLNEGTIDDSWLTSRKPHDITRWTGDETPYVPAADDRNVSELVVTKPDMAKQPRRLNNDRVIKEIITDMKNAAKPPHRRQSSKPASFKVCRQQTLPLRLALSWVAIAFPSTWLTGPRLWKCIPYQLETLRRVPRISESAISHPGWNWYTANDPRRSRLSPAHSACQASCYPFHHIVLFTSFCTFYQHDRAVSGIASRFVSCLRCCPLAASMLVLYFQRIVACPARSAAAILWGLRLVRHRCRHCVWEFGYGR